MAQKYPVDRKGCGMVPDSACCLEWGNFPREKNLRFLKVPPSVKVIRDGAFSGQETLETVTFCEGLETIENWAFSRCVNLQTVVIPDSVKTLEGWAFFGCTGMETAVFNASRTVLYYCPPEAAGERYVIPKGVRKIAGAAFIDCKGLKEIIIPEGVEEIGHQSFNCLDIEELILPSSLRHVAELAFFSCKKLKRVEAEDLSPFDKDAFYNCTAQLVCRKETPPEQRLRISHGSFLRRIDRELTQSEASFIEQEEPKYWAQRCAQGDAAAMLKLSELFRAAGTWEFYEHAANFWLYRASQFGNREAAEQIQHWFDTHGTVQMPGAVPETFTGHYNGAILRALGFSFFSPWEHKYYLRGVGEDGVVLVSAFFDEDGPDEGGFGWGDSYYDWWCLDSCLNYYPELGYIHNRTELNVYVREYIELRKAVAKKNQQLGRESQ